MMRLICSFPSDLQSCWNIGGFQLLHHDAVEYVPSRTSDRKNLETDGERSQ
jgi:hypothetical protein